jgi:predicted enzyme related to lactoylglutathione lyase
LAPSKTRDLTPEIGSRDTTAVRKRPNAFKRLVYVYIGTSHYDADRKFYREILDARLIWEFKEFGARVAAFDLCGEPYLLIADHVPAPSKRLIYQVEDLDSAARELKHRGWRPAGMRFEVPDGPCMNFNDNSGNGFAILQMTRPHLLEREFLKPRRG